MKLHRFQRLAVAVTAAALLAGGVTSRAVSVEISAATFISKLQQYVASGQIANARDALTQLQGFGITRMKIGDGYYAIDDLLLTLDNPGAAQQMLAMLSAYIDAGVTASFATEDRVVASVDWNGDFDLFPISSATA